MGLPRIFTTLYYTALLTLAVIFPFVASQKVINTLPGFPGTLPFYLETGYVSVGEMDNVELFYYFIESERSPEEDPLMIWLTGGPGCSAFSGLIDEYIGAFSYDFGNSKMRLPVPALKSNPNAWTKVANIIFLDSPVGTGFSYEKIWQGQNSTDTLVASYIYTFLRKWLLSHPKFQRNDFYLGGDSYSGIIIPIVAWDISNGNEIGLNPTINLKGYSIGNPVTDVSKDTNFRVQFAYFKGLISDELYESTKVNCKGEYIIVDPDNAPCVNDLQRVSEGYVIGNPATDVSKDTNFRVQFAYFKDLMSDELYECTSLLDIGQILEPSCVLRLAPKTSPSMSWDPSILTDDGNDFPLLSDSSPQPWCRSYNYLYSYIWENDKTVQNALGIREGTVKEWLRCNKSIGYTYEVTSSVPYHEKLIKKGYRALIYSGDHDMAIPYLATYAWIASLNLTIVDDWRPWSVDGQVAGYQIQYTYKKSMVTFATIKGSGHTATEYKPKEGLAMISRWLAYYHL